MLQKEFDKVLKCYEDYISKGTDPTHEEKVKYVNEQFRHLSMINKLIALSISGEPLESQVSMPTKDKPIEKPNKELPVVDVSKTTKVEEEKMPAKKPVSRKKKTDTTKTSTPKKTKKSTSTKTSSRAKVVQVSSVQESPKPEIDPIFDFKSDVEPTVKDILSAEIESWGCKDMNMVATALANLDDYVPNGLDQKPAYKDVVRYIAEKEMKGPGTVSAMISRIVKKADFSKSKYIPRLAKLQKDGQITNEVVVCELLDFVV